MYPSPAIPQWYVLQVRPNHESVVAALLCHKGYEEYLPSYQLTTHSKKGSSITAKKLFPGYVFCRFKYCETGQVSNGHSVVTTPGVIRVLGGSKPIPVQSREVTAIQRTLAARLTPEPWPFLPSGVKVEIEAGPLRGVSGIVVRAKGAHQLVLSVEVIQRSVAVTIDRRWLSPTLMIREALRNDRDKFEPVDDF